MAKRKKKICSFNHEELLVSDLKEFNCSLIYFNSRENINYVTVQMDLTGVVDFCLLSFSLFCTLLLTFRTCHFIVFVRAKLIFEMPPTAVMEFL